MDDEQEQRIEMVRREYVLKLIALIGPGKVDNEHLMDRIERLFVAFGWVDAEGVPVGDQED